MSEVYDMPDDDDDDDDDDETVIQNPTTIRNLAAERQAERDKDAAMARQYVDAALDTTGRTVYLIGHDRLLKAAQVYATLALRP